MVNDIGYGKRDFYRIFYKQVAHGSAICFSITFIHSVTYLFLSFLFFLIIAEMVSILQNRLLGGAESRQDNRGMPVSVRWYGVGFNKVARGKQLREFMAAAGVQDV